jgi:hypothetical protein
MTAPAIPDIDHALHDLLEQVVRERGRSEVDWLVRRARKERRDAHIDDDMLAGVVDVSTLLVWRPDGTVDHLLHLLDGIILTLRARAALAGRTDLWCTVALQPLLNICALAELPLVDGSGSVRRAASGHDVLVGPPGWLPPVDRYGVVGLRLDEGRLSAVAVDEADFPSLEEQQRVRELLAHHYRVERWYAGDDDFESRPGEMVRALALARQEDPDLLSAPHPPLDELLHLSLERDCDVHYWRDRAAVVPSTVSFSVQSMPEALHRELSHRAQRYGMSFDQYVIAVLGHLAWRTPFAEDMEPWDDWDPERTSRNVRSLAVAE